MTAPDGLTESGDLVARASGWSIAADRRWRAIFFPVTLIFPINEEAPFPGLLQGLLPVLVVGDGYGTPKEGDPIARISPTSIKLLRTHVVQCLLVIGVDTRLDLDDSEEIVHRLMGDITTMVRRVVIGAADKSGGEEGG